MISWHNPAVFSVYDQRDGKYDAVERHLNILDEAASHGCCGGGRLVGAEEAWLPAQHGQPLVRHVVHRPEVGRPVGVAQTPVRTVHLLNMVTRVVDAVPESTYHPEADPNSDFYLMRIRFRLFTLMRIPNMDSNPSKSAQIGSYFINFGSASTNWCRSGSSVSLMRTRIVIFILSGSGFLLDADADPGYQNDANHPNPQHWIDNNR